MSEERHKIRVGSRKSELALIQTRHVIALLKKLHPDIEFEIVTMSTMGDKILDIPLPKIGEKSLFTKELETALIEGSLDFVVHSLKDLPTTLPPNMAIGAVLTREDPRDALVLHKDHDKHALETLPPGSVIGTSSLRRTAQLAKKYPHLKVENIRGNLNTRLKKLDELGKYQGIILAAAGLIRMGWTSRITKLLDTEEIMYAVGQGALAVECRESDERTIELLKPLYDLSTALRVIAERSFLKTLGGGCSAPVAVSSKMTRNKDNKYSLKLQGAVWSLDGKEEIAEAQECQLEIKDKKPCNNCVSPHGSNDIENIKRCDDCPLSPVKAKKPKLSDISTELLKNDPHEQCPVQIPVGLDFMGKCPYLESGLSDSAAKDALTSVLNETGKITLCPYSKQLQTNIVDVGEVNGENKSNTYCGLVPYDNASSIALETATQLGKTLAEMLMGKGASEVMAKAQATIHGDINVSAIA